MRKILADNQIEEKALKSIENFHAKIVDEVVGAIAANEVVVVGMGQNPYVKKAKNLLNSEGIAFRSLDYGNYFSMWKERLAIKLWSGWPTFPQIYINKKLVGGYTELVAHFNSKKK